MSLKINGEQEDYYIRACINLQTNQRFDGQPQWMGTRFNLFPIVRDSMGVPWAEAIVFISKHLENNPNPVMDNYHSIADDLGVYLRFCEEKKKDWRIFPEQQFLRPTYAFSAEKDIAVLAGEISAKTARRQVGTVIKFYRWVIAEGIIEPKHLPWVEGEQLIPMSNLHGKTTYKNVKTTDLRIEVTESVDPYSEYIEDEGKLRPLPQNEQDWIFEALENLGNPELTLIHLFMILTGARIQTALTFRVCDVTSQQRISNEYGEIRIPVGAGTGIDTKKDKKLVIHIPTWFYDALMVYAKSERAIKRRLRAKGGDVSNQYLFLSNRGEPLYATKADNATYDDSNQRRYKQEGQAVRQLINDYILPFIRKKYDAKFHYRPHDLRATFGMNMTDRLMILVEKGEMKLHEVREFVKTRMGHEDTATTEKYLDYRGRIKFIRQVNDGYGDHLKEIIARTLKEVS